MSKNNFQNVLFSIGVVLFIIAFYYAIVLFLHFDLGDLIDTLSTREPNEIGDTVGGILNPLFAISICIFTGLAFYAQFEANKQVQEQFLLQFYEKEMQMINEEINIFVYYSEETKKDYQGLAAISALIVDMINDKVITDSLITIDIRKKYPHYHLYLKIIMIYNQLLLDVWNSTLSPENKKSILPKLSFLKDAKVYGILPSLLSSERKSIKPLLFEAITSGYKTASERCDKMGADIDRILASANSI